MTDRADDKIFAEPFEDKTNGRTLSLVVDDEEDICFLLKDILSKKDIDNVCVNNLADAQVFLQSHDPSFIFLDNKLSDGLGIDIIGLLKTRHPTSKIIMITANDNFKDRAFREGADYFICKPFSKQEILDIVEKAIV